MANSSIRVLVVDDTAIYRKIVSDVLSELPDIEVVGRATNGQVALQQIERLRPDIVTLDVEMPVMDGLEVLRRLRASKVKPGVIMLSARTARSAEATVTALKLGALDFVLKPGGRSISENIDKLRESLASRVRSLGGEHRLKQRLVRPLAKPARTPQAAPPTRAAQRADTPRRPKRLPQIVAVGISTGGPQALQRFLPRFPKEFPVPIVLVQHMPPVFTRSLANDLDKRCAMTVCEGEEGQSVLPGHVYIAPGGKQMRLVNRGGGIRVGITDDPPENSCRPSVDYLFRSVCDLFKDKTLGVIMTGMGSDGSSTCRQIRQAGGTIYCQDAESCVVYGMPRQPIEDGIADFVGPPERLASEIVQLLRRKELACR